MSHCLTDDDCLQVRGSHELQTFLEAFTAYRLRLGLPAAVIQLPAVEDIGRVAELNMGKRLKSSIGGTLSAEEVYTLVEGAIIGPSAGLGVNGRHLSWSLVPSTEVETLPWERFMANSVMKRQRIGRNGPNHSQSDKANQLKSLRTGSLGVVMDALMDKVSSMTAMDKDEITPTRSLIDYGLDSLIALELRNWIRRNFDVLMETSDINTSRDLRAITDYIFSHMKTV
jgi:acyl carrier protein